MKRYIKQILSGLLCVEICIFIISFIRGEHGYISVAHLHKERSAALEILHAVQQDVGRLQMQIAQLSYDEYYYERIAREQLHMMYPHESIFVYKNT